MKGPAATLQQRVLAVMSRVIEKAAFPSCEYSTDDILVAPTIMANKNVKRCVCVCMSVNVYVFVYVQ